MTRTPLLFFVQSSISNCRRSSSDISHETPDFAKTQRECRLRPHFSDPMPTDAVKRKQLELKIAAAARQHAQKHRHEREHSMVTAYSLNCAGVGVPSWLWAFESIIAKIIDFASKCSCSWSTYCIRQQPFMPGECWGEGTQYMPFYAWLLLHF